MGYTDGCEFKMGVIICQREIPISEARRLFAEGKTEKLYGFISKRGKPFSGKLAIKDGDVVFDFDTPLANAAPDKKPTKKSTARKTKKE